MDTKQQIIEDDEVHQAADRAAWESGAIPSDAHRQYKSMSLVGDLPTYYRVLSKRPDTMSSGVWFVEESLYLCLSHTATQGNLLIVFVDEHHQVLVCDWVSEVVKIHVPVKKFWKIFPKG